MEATRLKLRAAAIGRHMSAAARAKMSAAKRGPNHPNYGKHLTDEQKAKIRARLVGRTLPRDVAEKISAANTGAGHWNWQGGKSHEPYADDWTPALRARIRTRDGNVCRLCGARAVDERQGLDVHHIDYDKMNSSEENLVSLCKSCHARTEFGNRAEWRLRLSVAARTALTCIKSSEGQDVAMP